jgi:DNA-binding MarR family transcriptional regulator
MTQIPKNIDVLLEHITSLLTSKYNLVLSNELGISYSQYKVLVQFSGNSIIRQKTIAKFLGQTEASISRQLGIMDVNGLIHKTYDPDNRKSIIVTLTQKGHTVKNSAENIVLRENSTSLRKVSAKDQKLLTKNLTKIHDQICTTDHNY